MKFGLTTLLILACVVTGSLAYNSTFVTGCVATLGNVCDVNDSTCWQSNEQHSACLAQHCETKIYQLPDLAYCITQTCPSYHPIVATFYDKYAECLRALSSILMISLLAFLSFFF